MIQTRWAPVVAGMLLAGVSGLANPPADVGEALQSIQSVGPEGRGNAEAGRAWSRLAQAEAASLPYLLQGMDGANELALNWLRAAVETIVERELKAGRRLPLAALGEFLLEVRHHPRARRLAYETIQRIEPEIAEKLLAGLVNDPSLELRREAVQRLIDQSQATLKDGKKEGAIVLFQQALLSARDVDQIQSLSTQLKALDRPVDVARLFGFLSSWSVVGPFDNTGGKGFDAVYPPEREVDVAAEYAGKTGMAWWTRLATSHELGMVDINKALGPLKGAVAYALTELTSTAARPAELRLGIENSWKIWFNGRLVFAHDEYHAGTQIDHYRLPVTLKAGRNTILVKVCQNEMIEDWTKAWEFQLRICDDLGTSLLAPDSLRVVEPEHNTRRTSP